MVKKADVPGKPRTDAVGIGIGSKGYLGTGVQFSHDSGWWEYTPNISSVTNIEQSEKIKVFPNPVTDILKFDSNGPEIKTFSIYSVMGQLVKSGTATDHTIPVAELPEGVNIFQPPTPN